MRRLDEEMQLNAFLFRDVEGKATGGLGEGERKAVEEKSGSDDNIEDGRKKAEDGKKKYILQRAQNMVYQYKKKGRTLVYHQEYGFPLSYYNGGVCAVCGGQCVVFICAV